MEGVHDLEATARAPELAAVLMVLRFLQVEDHRTAPVIRTAAVYHTFAVSEPSK